MKQAAKNKLVAPYFRYVNIITSLRDSYGLKDLSPQHEALLEFIVQAWQDDKPLSVRKLMAVWPLSCNNLNQFSNFKWVRRPAVA